MSNRISFKEFMEQVEERLKGFSPETLRGILIEWAKSVPRVERHEFLNRLVPPTPQQQVSERDEELLEEIQELAKRVKEGDYCNGWGWDDEYGEERDWGDESWASEADEFFCGAYDSLVNGHYDLAVNAYALLFEILEMGEESGHLPGSPDPTDMIETDLGEARACYLRAVYLSSPPDKRPTRLLEGVQRFSYSIGDHLNLRSVINVQRETLPGFAEFLPCWIDLLKNATGDAARYLLREAVMLSGGISAIAELARQQGKSNPRLYVDWIKALEKEQNFQAVLEVAQEGLGDVPKDYVVRSEIGERMVIAGMHLNDLASQLTGWREAFYSNPSLANLLPFLSVSDQMNCRKQESDTAIARVISLLKKDKRPLSSSSWEGHDTQKATASETLLTQAYLLACRYEDAFNLCHNKGVLGWSYGSNPKGLVLPFFLKLLSEGKEPSMVRNVEQLWQDAIKRCSQSLDFQASVRY